jgi:hypothetical protein
MEESLNQHQHQHHHQNHDAPRSPVANSVAAVSLVEESLVSTAHTTPRQHQYPDDASTVASTLNNKSSSSPPPPSLQSSPLKPNASWDHVWMRLLYAGWEQCYHPDGVVRYKTLAQSLTELTLEQVQDVAREHYGWTTTMRPKFAIRKLQDAALDKVAVDDNSPDLSDKESSKADDNEVGDSGEDSKEDSTEVTSKVDDDDDGGNLEDNTDNSDDDDSDEDHSHEDDNDDNDDNEEDNKKDSNDELQTVPRPARAPRLIPTTKKERISSVVNLYTNGLDPPNYNRLHKAQQSVAADALGFREALENIVIPPEMIFLYQHCLAKPKESFFILAIAHIQVISKVCGLTTKEMIQIRGWVFLKKRSPKGAPYWYQTFSESVYETIMLGSHVRNNPQNLIYRFYDIVLKMRNGYADLTSNFPAPLVIPSKKTSKKRGHEGQPLTKYL